MLIYNWYGLEVNEKEKLNYIDKRDVSEMLNA